jgi:hypothetical protein
LSIINTLLYKKLLLMTFGTAYVHTAETVTGILSLEKEHYREVKKSKIRKRTNGWPIERI